MCVGSLAGVTYLRYTVLMSSNKSETAVHCCDPALSVLVMLVSRNAFHVVSALQSFAFINYYVPRPRTESAKRSLHYRASLLWNKIPSEIRKLPSLNVFKTSFHGKDFSNTS